MQKIFYLIVILFLSSCGKDMFTFPSAKDVPIDVNERVEKNIEEGRGISFGGPKNKAEFLILLHRMKCGGLQLKY